MVKTTVKKASFGGLDFVDLTFVILIFMSWVFISNAWKDPLASTMTAISVFVLSFYLIARYTGVLSFLELTKPFWTTSALISIPIWIFSFILLPPPANSFTETEITRNMLEYFISPAATTTFLQGFLFPVTESLLAAILFAFFAGVGQKRASTNKRKARQNVLAALVLISIFMSIIHISIVAKLAEAGVFEPGVLFSHQLLSFGIMLMLGLIFGVPGIIAPHIIKNILVVAPNSMGIWIFTFGFFILMDVASFYFAKQKEKQTVGRFYARFIP